MFKIILISILLMHGIIHLFGFVKAFNYAEMKELKLPISKQLGRIWLLTFVLFIAAAIQYTFDIKYWWLTTAITTIISQIIIIRSWQDAKFGTALNIIIILLLALTNTYSSFTIDSLRSTEHLSRGITSSKERNSYRDTLPTNAWTRTVRHTVFRCQSPVLNVILLKK